jgi:hypothetical protein
VEQFRPAWLWQSHDVLNVREAGGDRAHGSAVCESTPGSDKRDDEHATADLEPSIMDIAVRYPVTEKVQRDTEQSSRRARPHGSAHRRAGRGVKGDDHPASW